MPPRREQKPPIGVGMINEFRVLASAWLQFLSDIIHPTDPVRAPWPEDQPLGEWPDLPRRAAPDPPG